MNPEQASPHPQWLPRILRIALSLGAVLLLVHLARSKDVFADVTRPTVTFALNALGIAAADHGNTISVGRLEVPWTRDCAGLNLLLVLLAITIWVHRSEKMGWGLLVRLLCTIPAALIANVARVLTLIAYREILYPNVESPQLHYFLGLIWLLPFIAMVVPKGQRPLGHVMIEASQAAAVLALLAPMSGVPGGDAITLAAMMGLAHCRMGLDHLAIRTWLTACWMVVAIMIALAGMESFWLPWLLVCPALASRKWLGSITGVVLTLSTHPLFSMLPWGNTVTWAALGLGVLQWVRPALPTVTIPSIPIDLTRTRWNLHRWATAACFILPFIASTAFSRVHQELRPPAGTTCEAISGDGYEVRLPDQSEAIGLIWYNPTGTGRHHSMKVCLKYRGVDLEPTAACPDVFTDGEHWMREFYLQGSDLLPSYPAYIRQTFRPWASPGVHLIFVTNSALMDTETFNRACQELAARLHGLCLQGHMSA